ncbi:hypothetical protein [Pedobacter sp. WC2423]|uniref:hypothetical protein n=1 Tax=Pedobacter sp. WC2423 TaxID=3234142 RepID=UPI003467941B
MIDIIDNTDDLYDLTYANATLNTMGTPRAIPSLEKHLKSRKKDVKDSARYAIDEIKNQKTGSAKKKRRLTTKKMGEF